MSAADVPNVTGARGTAAVPLIVIGGYLGAGKTTLVNHLLRAAVRRGIRIAVLVNDFGELSVDADLIERPQGADGASGADDADGDVLSLAGGCVCCSVGADLVGGIERMARRGPGLLLVETSGVGLPAAVARTAALARGVRVAGTVVVADAATLRRQVNERYVGDTVRQQLDEADLLIVGKTDLVDAAALAALQAWLDDTGATAPRLFMPEAEAEPALDREPACHSTVADILFGSDAFDAREPAARALQPRSIGPISGIGPAAGRYVSGTRRYDTALDVPALAEALQREGLLRAKGLLLDRGGVWIELQLVGRRVDLREAVRPPDAAPGAYAGHLVTIALRGP